MNVWCLYLIMLGAMWGVSLGAMYGVTLISRYLRGRLFNE